MHNEITSIIDRLGSPSKDRTITADDVPKKVIGPIDTGAEVNSESESMIGQTANTSAVDSLQSNALQSDFIDEMQTEMNTASSSTSANAMNGIVDTEKYCQMVPYNTSDPKIISQQKSILELLISKGICNDETFKIFIAEPESHKDKAAQILDSLYCVDTMISTEYDNEATTEWVNSVESMAPLGSDSVAIDANHDGSIESNYTMWPDTTCISSIETNTHGRTIQFIPFYK